MKALITAGLIAFGAIPIASTAVHAEDVGEAIARGAMRGAVGGPDYGYRDGYRDRDDYRRDRWRDREESRSAYGDNCRTVTIERDDGSVRRTRRCD